MHSHIVVLKDKVSHLSKADNHEAQKWWQQSRNLALYLQRKRFELDRLLGVPVDGVNPDPVLGSGAQPAHLEDRLIRADVHNHVVIAGVPHLVQRKENHVIWPHQDTTSCFC